jgi:hypothetical protein
MQFAVQVGPDFTVFAQVEIVHGLLGLQQTFGILGAPNANYKLISAMQFKPLGSKIRS